MAARTFDLDDPAEYQEYMEHTMLQVALYGGLYLSFNDRFVTVHDARDVTIKTGDNQ